MRLTDLPDRIDTIPETGCWLYSGAWTPAGYGLASIDGKRQMTHRASWRLHRGEIPTGAFVCHRCDTPACINPDHLFLGTHEENMADMRAKGRGNGWRKLSLEQRREVVALASTRSQGQLSREYGVSRACIQQVLRDANPAG